MTTFNFTDGTGKPGFLRGEVATTGDITITRDEAARLLRQHPFALQFDIMAKNYGDDDDYVGITTDDLDEDDYTLDADWGPFEIWQPDVEKYLTVSMDFILSRDATTHSLRSEIQSNLEWEGLDVQVLGTDNETDAPTTLHVKTERGAAYLIAIARIPEEEA